MNLPAGRQVTNEEVKKYCLKLIELEKETQTIKPGIYRHYKGNLYEVIGSVRHSETLEELILYKALYKSEGENLWVRPGKMFSEQVEVEGKRVLRFTFVE